MSLRAKITGVTVGLMAIALIVAGIGTFVFVRTALLGAQDEQLMARAGANQGAGVYDVTFDDSGAIVALSLTDQASDYAVAIYDTSGAMLGAVGGDPSPQWPAVFSYDQMLTRGQTPFDVTDAEGKTFRVSAGPLDLVPGKLYTQLIALPVGPIDATLRTFLGIYALLATVAIVVGAISTRLLITRTFRPLGQVEDAARAIAAGDFSRRLSPADPRTEVGTLTNAINRMLGAVDTSLAEREATVRQMRRFIGDASHELRTPLVSVRGYAELYRLGAIVGETDTAQAMDRIEKEAIRMGGMVEDLLALARLDERRDVAVVPVDLRPIASDAAMDVRAAAPDRTVTVTDLTAATAASAPHDPGSTDSPPADGPELGAGRRSIASTATGALAMLRRRPRPTRGESARGESARGEGALDAEDGALMPPRIDLTPAQPVRALGMPPIVLGDENRIRQVVSNLLGNARRFSPEGSPIEIQVGVDAAKRRPLAPGGMASIAVCDHGEGVPPQIRAHIFQRFWRADTSRTRETGGSGLGLAIVASIVEALHGEIEVGDTVGGGATFRVWLPLAPVSAVMLDTQPLPRLDEERHQAP